MRSSKAETDTSFADLVNHKIDVWRATRHEVVQQNLPDGRVIFAIAQESPDAVDPTKDSIKAVTWTDADGTQGRIAVTQKHG